MPSAARRRTLTALATVTAALAVPAASQAAVLNISAGNAVSYTAGASKANNLSVSEMPGQLTVSEQSGNDPITITGDTVGKNCSGSGTNVVSCASINVTSLSVDLGTENIADVGGVYVSSAIPVTAQGGPGDDTISSFGTVFGEAGNDVLSSSGNGGTLNGGSGNDSLRPDFATVVTGGSDEDTVDYTNKSNVTVTIDNVANDGQGSNDNVQTDVENIIGTNGVDNLTGTSGASGVANKLYGGGGSDTLNGLDGADFLDGGTPATGNADADTYNGGAGIDTVTYSSRVGRLRVTVGHSSPDGEVNEGDAVGGDVENVLGGYGDDVLIGASNPNQLEGGGGDDDLQGVGGSDTLIGGNGDDAMEGGDLNDTMNGDQGDDTIDGGTGNDTLSGGGGFDLLEGDAGTDTLSGGAGGDTLGMRDGEVDTGNCGSGTDVAIKDAADSGTECETSGANAPAPPEGGNTPSNGAALQPAPITNVTNITQVIQSDALTVKCKRAKGAVVCRLKLPAGMSRDISAKLTRSGKVFAKASKKLRSAKASVKLTAVRRTRAGRYQLVIRGAGGKKLASLRISLK